MTPGPWQLLIIAVVALVLFGGRGKIPSLMKDLGKGITSFKKGLKDDDSSDDTIENKSDDVDVTLPSSKANKTSK